MYAVSLASRRILPAEPHFALAWNPAGSSAFNGSRPWTGEKGEEEGRGRGDEKSEGARVYLLSLEK